MWHELWQPSRRAWSSSTSGTPTARPCARTSPAPASTSWSPPVPASCSAWCSRCVGGARPVLTLVLCVAGSLLAAWLMLRLGERLGPADPHDAGQDGRRRHPLPSALRVSGLTPAARLPARHPWRRWPRSSRSSPGKTPEATLADGTARVGFSSEARPRLLAHLSRGAARPDGGRPCPTPTLDRPPQPPEQPGSPEYLEAGGGSPLPPETPAPPAGGGGRRRGLLIGGGVAALAVVGVGAWAAAQFFATGAQPSEALPAHHHRLRQHRPRPQRRPEDRGAAHAQQVPGVQGRARPRPRRRHPPEDLRGARPARGLPARSTTRTSSPGWASGWPSRPSTLGGEGPRARRRRPGQGRRRGRGRA